MADSRLLQASDDELGFALVGLATVVAWPDPTLAPGGADVATRVRARLVARQHSSSRRPLRWAIVLALVAMGLLAAVAAAGALGVPGIRLIFGDPGVSPPPTVAPPTSAVIAGSSIDLGDLIEPDSLPERVDFPVRFPSDPGLGRPDATYVSERNEVALVWAPNDDLPATLQPDIGVLLMQFRGSVSPEPIGKIIASGTTVEPVRLGDGPAYWIAGDPHVYFYVSPDGDFIEEGRRWVGDALIWQRGDMTYRIETALGRDAAIRIAESLR